MWSRWSVGCILGVGLSLCAPCLLGQAEELPGFALENARVVRATLPAGRTTWIGRIDVPQGAEALTVAACGDGNVDLYLRRGLPAANDLVSEADLASRGSPHQEVLRVTADSELPLRPGTWFVTVARPGAARRGLRMEVVAFVDRSSHVRSILPGSGPIEVARGDAQSITLFSFLPRTARSLVLDLTGVESAGVAFEVNGPDGYQRRGRGIRRMVLMQGESPPGAYVLRLRAAPDGTLPARTRARAEWSFGGGSVAHSADPLLEPGRSIRVALGGEWNPVLRQVRLVVPRNTAGFVIEAENDAKADVDLYIRRGGPLEVGDADADYFAVSSAPKERLVVGGMRPLPAGTYYCEVVLVDGCGPVTVRLSMRTMRAKPGRGTWGEGTPPPLATGRWIEGTVESGLAGVRWYGVTVPAGTRSLHALLLGSTAPLDLVLARSTDGSIMLRSLTPRVDERIDHVFRPVPRTPRSFVLGVLNRNATEDRVDFRVALGFDAAPKLPADLVWPPVLAQAGLSPSERVAAATVELTVRGDAGGSGTCVSPSGLILTCRHVLTSGNGARTLQRNGILVAFPQRLDAPPVQSFVARVVHDDKDKDLALLQLTSDVFGRALGDLSLPHVALGDSDALSLGDPVTVFGYPADGSDRSRTPVILTSGAVAGLERQNGRPRWIKTDAWIGLGHSGGGLFDERLRLVGVAAATLGSNEELGLAVPVAALPASWRERIRRESPD